MSPITPYRIAVPEEKLSRLHQKLALADFPDELEDSDWQYGAPLADVKRLTAYWHEHFDWRKAEAKLNELPQFTTDISVDGFDTLKIHFVHQKSEVGGAIPLLFSHGWPGSFVEASKILPELVKGGEGHPAFHVVVPSLPGYGFSEGTKKKGFGFTQYAEVCHKVMQALGYKEYVTQGGMWKSAIPEDELILLDSLGDWGYAITRALAYLYPQSVKATHTNFARPNPPTLDHKEVYFQYQQSTHSDFEKAGIERSKWFMNEGYGYNLEQGTKPQTIGYSMVDSPVGILAWIFEKLHDWTDNYPWTEDEILTWISIYVFSTAGPTAAARIYYESMHDKEGWKSKLTSYIDIPFGVTRFPKELSVTPRLWNKTMGPLVFESEYEHGGHFAAWENPKILVDDLRKMFGKDGGAYAVVKGHAGFE
ncbi:hypothetical protein MMC13_006248 [Lambiella insularis]|nr:hypothetical protein [Lambiella insularis]